MIMISNSQRDVIVRFVETFSQKADACSTRDANLARLARKAAREMKKKTTFKI